jgi:K+-transporting ATPase KdpF subunit
LIHRKLLSLVATVAPGNKRDRAYVMLDVVMQSLRPGLLCASERLRRTKMIFDYSLGALVAAGLLFYLIYALLRPERF